MMEYLTDSRTVHDQEDTQRLVLKTMKEHEDHWKDESTKLSKDHHIQYILRKLVELPVTSQALDVSQPWLAYWAVHALNLLESPLDEVRKKDIINLLKSFQTEKGGFAGGPKQHPHLATTYAAVNCLASLQHPDALQFIDRVKLLQFFASVKTEDGSFRMQVGGEVDVRGAYCALSVTKLLNLLDTKKAREVYEKTPQWIARCQTYEGGFGAQPGLEAHGGYTFCGLAAMCMLNAVQLIDVPRLLRWTSSRQMTIEGGFQGRTHKLVDSCYSFWVGACFPLLQRILTAELDPAVFPDESLFDQAALQKYLIYCCQKVPAYRPGLSVRNTANAKQNSSGGGMIDKPDKNPDLYHTCYALSGLSIAQHEPRVPVKSHSCSDHADDDNTKSALMNGHVCPARTQSVLGEEFNNNLEDLHPWFNVTNASAAFAYQYFKDKSVIDLA